MAPHSSTLAWKIPWTEEPGRLQSMGLLGVGHNLATSLSLSCIGEGNGNPLQYSCLEDPTDRGAWWATVHGVTKSWTRLSHFTFTFIMVQLSHPYMTTGKTIALTVWTFVSKVMSLLFNMLSRFATAFLPRSKCLLILWLQSPSEVILEPKKIKSVSISIFFPIYLP